MTWAEVSYLIVATNRFNFTHWTLTARVACCSEIDLERFLQSILVVGNGGAGHFDVIATEEEQKCVASKANDV